MTTGHEELAGEGKNGLVSFSRVYDSNTFVLG